MADRPGRRARLGVRPGRGPDVTSFLGGLEFGGGLAVVMVALSALCIAAGAAGSAVARRRGVKCPHCGVWGSAADVTIHRIREHGEGPS